MATRVILVRHGISGFNVQRRVQGHFDDSLLTDEGREGARKTGLALQGLSFNAVYSSPLKRARETAELITAQLSDAPTVTYTDLLKEINLSEWEGLAFDEVEQRFPEGYLLWRDRPHDLVMTRETPNGPEQFYPVRSLYEQARQLWHEVLERHSGETVLLVGHSGINRALIQTAIGLEAENYPRFHQTNCGISVLNFAGRLGDVVQVESMNLTAHLDMPVPPVRSGHKGPRLLLVRHGETNWNRDKRFQGQIDVPLNEQGRTQGEKASFFLQSIPIDRAVTSPMLRPKETAELILAAHPNVALEEEARLKEISHGLWEGKLEAEIEVDYATELQQWKVAPETVQMPEGENLQDVWERTIAAWDAIVASADGQPITILVVAHDAVNKAILCHLVDADPSKFWAFKQGNGAVSVIDYPQGAGGRPLLQAMNITSHLGSGVLDRTAAGAL